LITDELLNLAETIAQWSDKFFGLKAVHLFGSRVRGNYRPTVIVDPMHFAR
jgi:predicted nucleotidyltransferase